MSPFSYKDNTLFAEKVNCQELADAYGTPCYVYSKAAIQENYQAYENALQMWPHTICYAVKANSNIAVLNILAKLGAGFDIVSIGELERVIRAGGDTKKAIFSGVAKRQDEIRRALMYGIHCFNIESHEEMHRIQSIACEMDMQANVSLRVNPDVDAETHPYISTGLKKNKFGVDINIALDIYQEINSASHLNAIGVDCHIGSQLLDLEPFKASFEKVFALINQLHDAGIRLQHVDIGGGLGIQYKEDEQAPSAKQFIDALVPFMQGCQIEIQLEPGRSIVGNAGMLLTTVEHIKRTEEKNFALVDAAMNDFLRPSLYQAWHNITEVQKNTDLQETCFEVAGPVCETGDFLGKDRNLKIQEGSLLAVHSTGAYGFVMASNYNSRPRAAEILVDGEQSYLIRRRESIEDLFMHEHIPE